MQAKKNGQEKGMNTNILQIIPHSILSIKMLN